MESTIDGRYRELLFQYYLRDVTLGSMYRGRMKWIFRCPFCSPFARTEGRKKHKKGSLLWMPEQHSWFFSCAKKGSAECMNNMTFPNLIRALNPDLYLRYQLEREQSGTTGKGHNCSAPDWTPLNKTEMFRSNGRQDQQRSTDLSKVPSEGQEAPED